MALRDSPQDWPVGLALRDSQGASIMIGRILVDGTNRADVDTNEEDYSEKDIK